MTSLRLLIPVLVATAAGCGPDLRVFDVTITTVRNCHPAGLIPQLCDDKSTFENKRRTARVAVEIRGENFVLYDEQGRSIPGSIQRGSIFFGRTASTTRAPDGCQKDLETNIKFFLHNDFMPGIPRLHEHRKLHFTGNRQDRSSQSGECSQGQAQNCQDDTQCSSDQTCELQTHTCQPNPGVETSSKFEEDLEGDEVGDTGPISTPWWRL